MNHSTLNESFKKEHISDRFLTKIEIATLSAVFSIALLGNLAVIAYLIFTKNLKIRKYKISRMAFYILHLSVADIIVALFSILPQIIWRNSVLFNHSQFLCKFVTFTQVFSVYGATFAIVLMAFDRFSSVYYPVRDWTLGHALFGVLVSWSLAVLFSSPQMFLYNIEKVAVKNITIETCYVAWSSKRTEIMYICYHLIFQFVVPLMMLIFFYTKIFSTVSKYGRLAQTEEYLMIEKTLNGAQANGHDTAANTQTSISSASECEQNVMNKWYKSTLTKSKMKTLKLSFIIVITFILCGLPFYSSLIINDFLYKKITLSTEFIRIKLLRMLYLYTLTYIN